MLHRAIVVRAARPRAGTAFWAAFGTARVGTPVQTLSKLSPHECAPVHARRSSGDEGRASKHVERPSILPATGFDSASRRALLLMRSPHASVVSADR